MSEPRDVKVEVPGQVYMGPAEVACWEAAAELIGGVRRALANDSMAFSIVLSRVARDMREAFGIEEAKLIFQGFVKTWEQGAENDR